MDVSEQKDLEKKLAHMAQHDALTGLPNRVLFEEHLNHCIKSYKRYMHPFALMYLDIDHFKAINDVHGHTLSDKVLQTFATRISHCIRASDIAARLGGDEFVIMLKGLKIPDDAAIVSQKIIAAMQVPFEVEKN
jgi:diguanylate cyclase (GGDEF)-like protein